MSELTKGWLVGILPSVCRALVEAARACARPHSHALYQPKPTQTVAENGGPRLSKTNDFARASENDYEPCTSHLHLGDA